MARPRRRKARWWLDSSLLRSVAATTTGVFILIWQTVFEQVAQVTLVSAALALILTPAVAAAQWRILRGIEREDNPRE